MIPVNEPRIFGNEIDVVMDCLRTGWISSQGKYIDIFEKEWAEYCGMKHGVAVSNGTAALQLAVSCLKTKPGDEIIMPTFTIISCALAAIYNGAIPVLVDCDPKTWCMDVKQIEEKITERTIAIMPVHIFGHPVDMDPIIGLAKKYNLYVIEDAAEAHGAEYKGRRCGGLGDLACFSFYANKIITTGEGGMLLTNREDFYESLLSMRNLCFKPEKRFYHTELGYNFRMTNVQAAIGVAQIKNIDLALQYKLNMKEVYHYYLKDINELQLPHKEEWAKNVYWMYGIVLDENLGITADEFSKRLLARGVMTRPFFLGMHEQPVFHEMNLFIDESYPVAEKIARFGLYLPSGLTITDAQIKIVCKIVKEEVSKLVF